MEFQRPIGLDNYKVKHLNIKHIQKELNCKIPQFFPHTKAHQHNYD